MQREKATNDAARTEPVRHAQIGCCHVELLPRSAYEAAYTPSLPVIGFAFESQSGIHAFAGDRKASFRTWPNSLAFVPAGCDVYSRSCEGGEYLTLTAAMPVPDGPHSEQRRINDIVDPIAIAAAQALRRLLLIPSRPDLAAIEHHALTLRERALRVLGGHGGAPSAARWLTARRLRRIDDLIEARLDGPLTVQALASALGLSAGFFARAFTASVGKSPHAYVLDRRIARARGLLRIDARDLSAVALASGFSSHAHMSSAFRGRLGLTPSELRRQTR